MVLQSPLQMGACGAGSSATIPLSWDPLHVLSQDVLENESINLDWMFRHSLINDIVKVPKQGA